MIRPFLFLIPLLYTTSITAFAQDDALLPRVDAGAKLGTERSLGTGEIWVPLSQGDDRVLYGDLRYMVDDHDNQEGNIGIGYRQIVEAPLMGQGVAGAHIWGDRRRSEYGNNFYQTALGAEFLARDWDVRANAYIPLSGDKGFTSTRANTQNSDPYLANSGIYYDTGGQNIVTLVEEPQPGFDLELGVRVSAFETHIDAIRVYGGGYHFMGDKTEDVSGWRTRVVADITPSFSVGGRFQRDDERGSQGFLEATIRFPFKAKKSFREEGLRARLDESPERDVDIVTGAKVTRRETVGLERKEILSTATGVAQRVLHVDNTAAAGGDGSKQNPYNTLKDAEFNLQDHDVVYVHAGDGTTTGQEDGIVIGRSGVSLIGSGTNFVYDAGKFTANGDRDFSGKIIAKRTSAPVITNTVLDPSLNRIVGVLVTEGETQVAGVRVVSADYGVAVYAPGKDIGDVAFSDLTLEGNNNAGLHIESEPGDTIGRVSLSRISTNNNNQGVDFVNRGTMGDVTASSVYAHEDNTGIYFFNMGDMGDVSVLGSSMHEIGSGIYLSNYGTINDFSVSGISLSHENNVGNGLDLANYGTMRDVSLSGITSGQATYPVRFDNDGVMRDLHVSSFAGDGGNTAAIYLSNRNAGTMGDVFFSTISADDNNTWGINIHNEGSLSDILFTGVTANNNGLHGIYLENDGTVDRISMTLSSAVGNTATGVSLINRTPQNYTFDMSGGNSIYSNPFFDLEISGFNANAVDFIARNVWWGQPGGPLPAQLAVQAGTIDISDPLDSDPNL